MHSVGARRSGSAPERRVLSEERRTWLDLIIRSGRAPDGRVLNSARRLWRDPVIWALVILGLAIRVVYNLALHPGGDLTSTFIIDEREYFGAAHMLAEGRGFSFFDAATWVRPPLYVMMLAFVMTVGGISYGPALWLQALLSAATLLPLGWLAWRVGGLGAARWAVGLGALFLPFTLFAGLLLSETLFTLLLALALVALVRAREMLPAGLRKSAPWLVGSGVLLGLSALTRATALGFVPLAAIWLALPLRPDRITSSDLSSDETGSTPGRADTQVRSRLIAMAIMLAVCLVALIPWTVRNYAAYGKFVAIDTTGGYNLWLGSVGVRDEERLQADYRAIPNQADRQSYAYARAWENITADPLKFLGKGLKEGLDLWRPHFSAEERQVAGYALGRVPAWHLAALLLFDDVLYVAILCAAVLGLALSPPHSLKWLTGLWVLLWVVISFVFFAVTRFRLPVVAALIPWAGVGLHLLTGVSPKSKVQGSRLGVLRKLSLPVKVASFAALLAVLLVTLPELQVGETLRGVERWGQQEGYRRGETLLQEYRVQDAISAYEAANLEVADTRYALAAAYLRRGDMQIALSKLTANEPPDRFEPAIIRGEAARRSGDLKAAHSFFIAREVNVAGERALAWAWDHLEPSEVQEIELGSGLDVGYVRGFYGIETDADGKSFRWSGEHAMVRGLQRARELEIEWSGWRPIRLQSAHTRIFTEDIWNASGVPPIMTELPNAPGWTVKPIDIHVSGDTPFDLYINGFIGSGSDPRLLGVRVSKVEVAK
jgi:hypothetical protein